MPGGNRTGPLGQGPRTGRGLGYCSGFQTPGYSHPYGCRPRMGRGFGRGRGFKRRFWRYGPEYPYRESPYYLPETREPYPRPRVEDEKKYLENWAKDLEEELKEVKNRIKQLSEEKKEDL